MKLQLRHTIEYDGEWWKLFKDGQLIRCYTSREKAEAHFARLRDGKKDVDELIAEWEGEPK
jgi:hypothetical protein